MCACLLVASMLKFVSLFLSEIYWWKLVLNGRKKLCLKKKDYEKCLKSHFCEKEVLPKSTQLRKKPEWFKLNKTNIDSSKYMYYEILKLGVILFLFFLFSASPIYSYSDLLSGFLSFRNRECNNSMRFKENELFLTIDLMKDCVSLN